MAEDKPNTVNRDHDYGAAGNASYEQFQTTTAYEIAVTKKLGSAGDLEKLYKTLMEQIDNPKILGFIPARTLTDPKMQAGGREGVEDAFLEANINTSGFRTNTKSPTH
mgnify:CR=1 FL=1